MRTGAIIIIKIYNDMEKYKLKEEAKKYFADNLRERVGSIESWEYKGASILALELIPSLRIKYGIEKENYSDMCGWNKDGAIFNFAISFPSADMREYNNIKEHIPALMEELENTAKSFIENLK